MSFVQLDSNKFLKKRHRYDTPSPILTFLIVLWTRACVNTSNAKYIQYVIIYFFYLLLLYLWCNLNYFLVLSNLWYCHPFLKIKKKDFVIKLKWSYSKHMYQFLEEIYYAGNVGIIFKWAHVLEICILTWRMNWIEKLCLTKCFIK